MERVQLLPVQATVFESHRMVRVSPHPSHVLTQLFVHVIVQNPVATPPAARLSFSPER